MKLSEAFSILFEIRAALQFGLLPTLRAVTANPLLLFQPAALSRLFMANAWSVFGGFVDENMRELKTKLLVDAKGVVLDLGAGQFAHSPILRLINLTNPARQGAATLLNISTASRLSSTSPSSQT